jgi:hypothetical protein
MKGTTMKQRYFSTLRALLPAVLFALFLGACPMEGEDDENKEPDITFSGGQGEMELEGKDGKPRFFSLSTGTEITAQEDIESAAWDIAFYPTRMILTNSGYTAGPLYFSGGKGGVWHTNQTDFDAVTGKDDRVIGPDPLDGRDYGEYNQDVLRYARGMAGSNMQQERYMNVMTFVGYQNENLVDGKSLGNTFNTYYKYDKKAFYANTFRDPDNYMTFVMPPLFYVTNQVYIILHGDGEHYSKFQVYKFVRYSYEEKDVYGVRWENLP